MQDTEKKTWGGAGRGQGRKKKVREEVKSVNVVLPVSLIAWINEIAGDNYRSQAVSVLLSYARDIDKKEPTISLPDRLEMIKALKE